MKLLTVLLASVVLSALEPCPMAGVEGEVLCGTHSVFENRAARTGRKIDLNIVVLKALAPKPEPDPLVVLVGGPGQSATEGAAGETRRFASIRETRDILLVDQRGTGKSNPLPCAFASPAEAVRFFGGHITAEFVARCKERLTPKADLRFYTTSLAMDDLDDVRAALGYGKLNLYGGSYGTRAALVYLKQHPEMVRTVTLRAVVPPGSRTPLYQARDAQRALDLVVAACAADPPCAAAFPTFKDDIDTVFARLEKEPVTIAYQDRQIVFDAPTFGGAIRRALSDSATQRGIPFALQRARAGDFSFLRNAVAQTANVASGLAVGMNLAVICSEDAPFFTEEDVARETRGTFLGPLVASSLRKACADWPRGSLPADYHALPKAAVPALILSGEADPTAPPSWGEMVARALPGSRHVVMSGIAHAPFPQCAVNLMAAFVASGSVSGLDTSCAGRLSRGAFPLPR